MIVIDKEECDYCGTCVAICPENCIDLLEQEIDIDYDLCTECKLCIYVCPIEVISDVAEKEV